jgi:hypothetical protein
MYQRDRGQTPHVLDGPREWSGIGVAMSPTEPVPLENAIP